MSYTLFTSDNLTILGEARLDISSVASATPAFESKISNYLRLIVSILVNGKLKTFHLEFSIDKSSKLGLGGDYYTFTNWHEWETFRRTIEGMGYSLGDFSISRAIEELTGEQSITVTEYSR